MQVLVKAKDGFIHGEFNLQRGQEAVMDDSLARELSHLVEIKTSPAMTNKMLPDSVSGNAAAAGRDAPSPSSPAAQVLPKATAKVLEPGAKKAATEK
jgi:hypothetical protein